MKVIIYFIVSHNPNGVDILIAYCLPSLFVAIDSIFTINRCRTCRCCHGYHESLLTFSAWSIAHRLQSQCLSRFALSQVGQYWLVLRLQLVVMQIDLFVRNPEGLDASNSHSSVITNSCLLLFSSTSSRQRLVPQECRASLLLLLNGWLVVLDDA